MNEDECDSNLNRRDFLKGGSAATIMTALGGAQLFAGAESPPDEEKSDGPKIKVGLIGLGAWGGRDLINALARVPQATVAAVCDTYPAAIKRCGDAAPDAVRTDKYQAILDDKEIKAVLVATPTHLHKEIVLAALKAGKHVYCEAPLANTIADAREIGKAAQDARQLVFQAGLQLRSDKERTFLWPFIQSGALGRTLMVRAQWHKKQSWRLASPNPEREKAINWRLNKADSLGLVGEVGIHQIDQAAWFLASRPVAISGLGSVLRWTEDGREVADTVQLLVEFPSGVNMIFDATLGNSFDSNYDVFYGDAAAIMLRDEKAWMFKEADSLLFGWEVYAAKTKFLDETGIALVAGASKSVSSAPPTPEEVFKASPLFNALDNFIRNAADITFAVEDTTATYGDDPALVREAIAKVRLRAAAGPREGFQATVTVIKANEAIENRRRVILKPELYELS
jgi:predicted dehydrogenase